MKILKKIFIGLLVLIVVLLVVALFLPKTYTVSVATTINKPKQEVFDYVKLIKNQEKYSVWVLEDPNTKPIYKGVDGTVGFVSAWNSEITGVGEQEITKIIDGERIDVDLRFKKPMESNQKAATILKEMGANQTQVISEFYGSDPYPFNLLSFIGKNMITDAETKNLKNLKDILEKTN
jgi:hypothetical protein